MAENIEPQQSVAPGKDSIDMLSSVRDECFNSAGDLDLPLNARNEFSARCQKLSDVITDLTVKNFHQLTPGFKDIQTLKATNEQLSKQVNEFSTISKTADNVQKVLSIVDGIIGVGATLLTLV